MIPHIPSTHNAPGGGDLARLRLPDEARKARTDDSSSTENAAGKAELGRMLRGMQRIQSQQLASRSAEVISFPVVMSVFRAYDKNPHSIYLIHFATSLINHVRRVQCNSPYDAFGEIS
jgi:hypothetical protein